jgi:phage major head subunit gpT-like protein
MALLTKAVLQALQTSVSFIFRGAYRDTPTPVDTLATVVSSTHKIETYGWMQRLLAMREWVGPRVIQGMKTQSYTLENKSFESTLGVDREEIEDDSLGLFNPRAAEFGRVAARIWFQLLIDALAVAGTTGLGFDGLSLLNASHTLNPAGVQSNKNIGTTVLARTMDLAGMISNQVQIDKVVLAMRNFTGEDGRFLGVSPTHLIVSPLNEMAARQAVGSGVTMPTGGTNVFSGYLEVLVIPELMNVAAGEAWYVADLSAPIKPLILQKRKEVELVSKTSLTDDNVFWQREFIWGIDCRGVAGYGPWWLIASGASAP